MLSYAWHQFYGAVFLLVSGMSLPLHILVGWAVFRMPSFRRRIVLPMVFSLSVCDSIQLVAHAYSGYLVLAGDDLDPQLNIIIGMTLEGLWCITLYQHVAIALNRLYIFTKKGVPPESILGLLDLTPIFFSWLGGLFYALCYVYEGRDTHFDKRLLSWSGKLKWKPFNLVLLYTKLSLLIAGLIACFLVIVLMMLRRRGHALDRRVFKPIEIQLFMQTSTVFLIAIVYTFMWYFIDQSEDNVHTLALINLDQIVICALSPYLNLIMSSEIRKSVTDILNCRCSRQSQTEISRSNSQKNSITVQVYTKY